MTRARAATRATPTSASPQVAIRKPGNTGEPPAPVLPVPSIVEGSEAEGLTPGRGLTWAITRAVSSAGSATRGQLSKAATTACRRASSARQPSQPARCCSNSAVRSGLSSPSTYASNSTCTSKQHIGHTPVEVYHRLDPSGFHREERPCDVLSKRNPKGLC
jgi:hypothetical protein